MFQQRLKCMNLPEWGIAWDELALAKPTNSTFVHFPRKVVACIYIISSICIPTKKRANYFLANKQPKSISTVSAHLISSNCTHQIKTIKQTWPNGWHSHIDFFCLREGNTRFKNKIKSSQYVYVLFKTGQFRCMTFIMLFTGIIDQQKKSRV